jgi:hypothetical protein
MGLFNIFLADNPLILPKLDQSFQNFINMYKDNNEGYLQEPIFVTCLAVQMLFDCFTSIRMEGLLSQDSPLRLVSLDRCNGDAYSFFNKIKMVSDS